MSSQMMLTPRQGRPHRHSPPLFMWGIGGKVPPRESAFDKKNMARVGRLRNVRDVEGAVDKVMRVPVKAWALERRRSVFEHIAASVVSGQVDATLFTPLGAARVLKATARV
eukprot:Hpha_TRINITY_DN36066_c0_g1::TRINITY_DN36066_c0_g1_i1::g.170893::m.170893